MTQHIIRLPLFTLMLPDGSGPMFIGFEQGAVFLTLFTSAENAILFAQRWGRTGVNTALGEMQTAAEVKTLLEKPSRHSEQTRDFLIMFDPIAPDVEFMSFTYDQVLAAFSGER